MEDRNELGCWLTLKMHEQHFMISVDHVVELTKTTGHPIAELPGSPPAIVGTMRLRDKLIPLIDLRIVLGLPSMREETKEVIELLDSRRTDHINWLNELESSVREQRAFTLTTDPHACKFGVWYDALMGDEAKLNAFTNGNLALRAVLEEFADPHAQIHQLAVEVTGLVGEGRAPDALAHIVETRETVLGSMVRLFDRAKQITAELRQPLVVVVESDGVRAGLLIDEVDAIRRLGAEAFDPVPGELEHSEYVTAVCTRDENRPLHVVLSVSSLIERLAGALRRSDREALHAEAA
ncbi:MAG: chemotaxis protein CheW [Phycisphaeraceae bacterium]|nr:MAG: chemotaxis protein CheW [Phycisphaeraceae bacterium]